MTYGIFLPSGHVEPPIAVDPKRIPRDPESTPERQRARRLGHYGAMLLRDHIKVEYQEQVSNWERHIKNVVTAFSNAIEMQNITLTKAKEEHRASTELALLLFSLLAGGVLGWVGTFVQYKIFPRLFERPTTKVISVKDAGLHRNMPHFFQITEMDYNRQMAAFVGGNITGAGTRVVNYLGKSRSGYPFEGMTIEQPITFVRKMDSVLLDALKDGTAVVAQQMNEAVVWMQQSPQFGESWAARAKGNESVARDLIFRKLQSVRDMWASQWPYFGRDPRPFSAPALSNSFERALWAPILEAQIKRAIDWNNAHRAHLPQFTPEDLLSGRLESHPSQMIHQRHAEIVSRAGIGNTIVGRLKELNVVFAETLQGKKDQESRKRKEEDKYTPAVRIQDGFFIDELRRVLRWAVEYKRKAPDLVQHAGAEGVPRRLKPFPTHVAAP